MIGRIVEVADDHRHLSLHRGFLQVQDTQSSTRAVLGQVPLDLIAAVIAHAHGLSYTNNLLVALAQRNIPFVLCNEQHNAVGMLLPIEGNFEQGRRMDAQLSANHHLLKRMWAQVVRSKLQQQASVLQAVAANAQQLVMMSKRVKAADADNLEAQGARIYWPLLMGAEFRRDKTATGLNALLNYGYTVLRAATARAVVGAGLHPSLGLFHSNDNNAMRLVDDLMEPFRPMVDLTVWKLQRQNQLDITPDTKRALVQTLHADMQTSAGVTPVMVCAQRLATSLAQVYLGQRSDLDLPLPGLPLALAAEVDAPEF